MNNKEIQNPFDKEMSDFNQELKSFNRELKEYVEDFKYDIISKLTILKFLTQESWGENPVLRIINKEDSEISGYKQNDRKKEDLKKSIGS
jgi:hypothetical protein